MIKDKLDSELYYNNIILKDKRVLKNNILLRLVKNNISISELKDRAFMLDISLHLKYYMVSIIKFDKSSITVEKLEDI
jgi:hypothetical protein